MKKIFFPVVLLALMFVFSCTKETYTEEDAQKAQQDLISYQDSIDQANAHASDSLQQVRDSLNKIGGIIQYSVSVIPVDGGTGFVSTKSAEKTKMLSGATVVVSQHGVLLTVVTDESGIAVFNDLRVGTLNVHVRAEGYTTTNFIAEVKPENDPNVNVYYDVLRHAATMVPVFSLTENTSTISGVVTFESDLTNAVPENASGATVIAAVDVTDGSFSKYLKNIDGDAFGVYNAPIVQIAYTELVASAVTNASGVYSIDMPSAADGLPIKMEVSDIAVNQKLLLSDLFGEDVFGVQTVRTVFGTLNSASSLSDPAAAYVTFSAPTGVVTQQPLVDATATAIIGESGIASIIITDQGSGYTQAPVLKITGDGVGATAVAYISQGKVTSVEITNAGQGYSTAAVAVLAFGADYGTEAEATPIIAYGVTKYKVLNMGSGYQTTPEVVVTSSSGSGATAKAVMSGYVSKIKVTNMGSGYTCPPAVQIERGTGNIAKATPTMTEFNPIHSIELTDAYTGTFETTPSVVITKVSSGSGATAIAQLSTAGEINDIVLSNAGLGYTEAPTVLIIGGGGMGAVAQAILNPIDGSISIDILEPGSGYTSDPTVQISAPPTGGTAPVVDHVVRVFEIEKITITNAGSGYDIVSVPASTTDQYNFEPDVIIDGSTLNDDEVIVRPDMKVASIAVNLGFEGSDYAVPPMVTITPSCGFGSGATAVTEILFNVKEVVAVSEGSGYKDAEDVIVTIVTPPEGCLTQATAEANLGAGSLESVTLVNPGKGYTAPPAIYLLEDGDRIYTLKSTVSQGALTTITFDPISGLESAPGDYEIEIAVVEDVAVFGTKAYPQSGKISFIEIVNPGEGYTVEPMVKFERRKPDPLNPGNWITVEDGGFISAQATAVIADGRVVEINITNTGTGYYYPPKISIYVPNGLKLAEGTVNINGDGYITGVTITDDGEGYSTPPTVTFTASIPGKGAGATATAVVKDGAVTKVVMTNNGSGYLGKNTPSDEVDPFFTSTDDDLNDSFDVYAGKSYIRDIYLGTGKRTVDSN